MDRSIYLSHSTLSFGMSPSSTAHGYKYLPRARGNWIFTTPPPPPPSPPSPCNYIYNYLLEKGYQPHPQAGLAHLPWHHFCSKTQICHGPGTKLKQIWIPIAEPSQALVSQPPEERPEFCELIHRVPVIFSSWHYQTSLNCLQYKNC